MSARRHRQLFLPFGAEQHFELVHGRHRDAVAVCTKTGARFEQGVYEHDHAGELLLRYAANGGTNIFQSQNGFLLPVTPTAKGARTFERVSSLAQCFVDLDVYNVGLEGIDAHELLDKACDLVPWMPLPTAVISSGRGYYFQWAFTKPLSREHLPAWQWVENALVEALEPLGADPAVKDAPRVLRVVGTIHGGTGRVVEGNIIQTAGPIAFERLERAVRAGVASSQGQPSQRDCEHRPASDAQRRQYLRWAELHRLRMSDCHKIAELRGSPKMDDCRRRLTLVYAVSGSWYWSDREQAEYELAEFSRQHFKHANRYTGSHVRNIVDLMVNAKSGPAMKAWRGMLVPVRFRLTHSTIIRSLRLTLEEQRHMQTIIGHEERQRRRTERRRDAGMEPAEAIHARAAERHSTAVRMKAEGHRQKDIAQALGITEARVSQMLKAARTAGT